MQFHPFRRDVGRDGTRIDGASGISTVRTILEGAREGSTRVLASIMVSETPDQEEGQSPKSCSGSCNLDDRDDNASLLHAS